MTESSLNTVKLHRLWDRMRHGDLAARNELLQCIAGRFERLASRMLRQFPGVARFEQTADVAQNATLRLMKALEEIQPESVRELMGLAAVQVRRELLDLARHHQGRDNRRVATIRQGDRGTSDSESGARFDPATNGDPDAESWEALHLAVEQLPAEEREVFSLVFYHGWTQPDVAELFHVADRTVRRWWQSACLKLNQSLSGNLPPTQSRR